MFDIGFWELLILFGLGLVILGPERLPRVAMQVGNWAGQARRMARNLTAQMRAELDLEQQIGGYQPKQAKNWQRPGMDDLKPGAEARSTGDAADAAAEQGTDEADSKHG